MHRLLPPSVTLHMPSITLQMPSITLQVPSVTLQVPSVTLQVPSVTLQVPSVTLPPPSVSAAFHSIGVTEQFSFFFCAVKDHPKCRRWYPPDLCMFKKCSERNKAFKGPPKTGNTILPPPPLPPLWTPWPERGGCDPELNPPPPPHTHPVHTLQPTAPPGPGLELRGLYREGDRDL